MKNGQIQFNEEEVAQFYGVNYLAGCVIQTEAGSVDCDVIVIPRTAFKDAKPKMDAEGEIQPSKGVRANVSAKSGDEWGMAFNNGIGLQVSVYKMHDKPKNKSIFASEEGEA